jgi:hypothetical protein
MILGNFPGNKSVRIEVISIWEKDEREQRKIFSHYFPGRVC